MLLAGLLDEELLAVFIPISPSFLLKVDRLRSELTVFCCPAFGMIVLFIIGTCSVLNFDQDIEKGCTLRFRMALLNGCLICIEGGFTSFSLFPGIRITPEKLSLRKGFYHAVKEG